MFDLIFLVFIILSFFLWLDLNRSKIKGEIGESFVRGELNKLDKTNYIVLNDILLLSEGSLKTTQIDHVLISVYGVFCIETKNYKGWIFGNARHKYWTQVIYHRKQKFYNPLWQNTMLM